MNKKKWALLLLAAILIFGYIKLFYKTYSETYVAKSADCIIVLDVKRITNTLIWNYITTPSQWKPGKLFSKKSNEVSWKDMFVLPDYVFAFHANNQPANAWYMLLTIKDKKDFEKGLLQFQFEKINDREQVSKVYGLRFYVQDDKVLIANAAVADTAYMAAVADELFIQKAYIPKTILAKAIDAKSHLAVYIAANNFLQKEAVIAANFNKQKIEVEGIITPGAAYNFTETNFQYSSASLSAAGFTQSLPNMLNQLSYSYKEKISATLNVPADSLFRQNNKSYSLDLTAITQRNDSAISYTYDEEFNKVEKVVVNNIQEPAFNFMITGDSVSSIYRYLQRNNKIEKTAAGDLFTPMPLVRSYCSIKNEKQLNITAFNYTPATEDIDVNAVFFLNLNLAKIPANLQKYLPTGLMKAVSNIATVKLSATKNNDQVLFSAVFEKMKNDLSILNF
ncbi:MAG: hypothetical protein ABI685_10700 [Ferruginibacter sp.]